MELNKKFKNIILAIVIIVLFGTMVYFVGQKKSESIPVSINQTTSWNTYSNTRYSYIIEYPTKWSVDMTYSESDFTQRGLMGDSDFIGGDTTWSNYQNSSQYNIGNIPADLESVHLLIYKTDTQTTLDSFINLKHFSFSKKENININGLTGVQITTKDPEGSSVISKIVLLKVNNKIFDFSYGGNSINSVMMDKMLQSFKLK
jgi:hypothetical protein